MSCLVRHVLGPLNRAVRRQVFQSRIFFGAIVPSEYKRHNAGAACDVGKICSASKQFSQRLSDSTPNDIVRATPHAARHRVPVLQGLHYDCVRL